jgi:hypothetical protein
VSREASGVDSERIEVVALDDRAGVRGGRTTLGDDF